MLGAKNPRLTWPRREAGPRCSGREEGGLRTPAGNRLRHENPEMHRKLPSTRLLSKAGSNTWGRGGHALRHRERQCPPTTSHFSTTGVPRARRCVRNSARQRKPPPEEQATQSGRRNVPVNTQAAQRQVPCDRRNAHPRVWGPNVRGEKSFVLIF